MLGISVHNKKEWKYFIVVGSTEYSYSIEKYDIPVATWAVFSGQGTKVSLKDLECGVITEWLPTSGYEYAEVQDRQVYIKTDLNEAKLLAVLAFEKTILQEDIEQLIIDV